MNDKHDLVDVSPSEATRVEGGSECWTDYVLDSIPLLWLSNTDFGRAVAVIVCGPS